MILVIGGSGSGKSAYAEKVALECQKEKRHFYLATMHVFGEEGKKRWSAIKGCAQAKAL